MPLGGVQVQLLEDNKLSQAAIVRLIPCFTQLVDVALQVPLSQKDMTVQDAAKKVVPLEKDYELSVGELKRFKEAAAHFTSDLAAFSRGKGWSDLEALLLQLHVSLRRSKAQHTPYTKLVSFENGAGLS